MEIPEITPAQTIKNAHDSVGVIAEILAQQSKTSQDIDTIKRNVEHLQLICDKDFAQDFAEDISVFLGSISSAK